jgi:hypothetical protein
MSDELPHKELMISFNFLFPDALEEGDIKDYTGRISTNLQKVISEELNRLGVRNTWDSTRFLHLGTEIIADSTRCYECGCWVIPEEHSHRTSVVASGWRVGDGRILCDQCWSLYDGEKLPITQ